VKIDDYAVRVSLCSSRIGGSGLNVDKGVYIGRIGNRIFFATPEVLGQANLSTRNQASVSARFWGYSL
jgi:hypothetical protein